ncbi:hypothetical protein, partial [Chryseobacterium taiwanense]
KDILAQCSFEFDFKQVKNKQFYTKSKADDVKLLRRLAYSGLEKRYGNRHEIAQKRVEKELKVIDELNFCS